MQLDISEEELDELHTTLEGRLADVRVELRRTDKPEWKDRLRDKEALLNGLLSKLEGSGG